MPRQWQLRFNSTILFNSCKISILSSGILVLYHWNYAWHFLMAFSGGVSTWVYDTAKDHTEEIFHTLISALQKSMEKTWGQMLEGAGFRVQSHEMGWADLTTHCQYLGVVTVVLPIFPLLPTPLARPPLLSWASSDVLWATPFLQFTSLTQHKLLCRLGGRDQIVVSAGLVSWKSSQEGDSRTKVSERDEWGCITKIRGVTPTVHGKSKPPETKP